MVVVVDTGRRVFSGLEGSTVSYPFTSVPPEPRLPGEDASIAAHSEVTGRNERRSQGAAWYMARNSRVSNHDHDCGGTVRASLNSKACVREILPKADARSTHSAAMSISHSLMATAGCRIAAWSAVRMLWNSSRGRGHLDIDGSPNQCSVSAPLTFGASANLGSPVNTVQLRRRVMLMLQPAECSSDCITGAPAPGCDKRQQLYSS